MPYRVCPWWLGYLLASPLRRLYQDPRAILSPHLQSGMTVVETGPGMGFFTLDIARLVGPGGRVVAIDVQPKMLDALKRRAKRAGLPDRVDTRLVAGDATGMEGLDGQADFVLAFAVVHELPDMHRFFAAAGAALKPGGSLLLAEPSGHVTTENFTKTLAAAEAAGLRRVDSPRIRGSRTALLEKGAGLA
jgi:ubiquinone/menaquinone biosynthesis C-methylase UbiE